MIHDAPLQQDDFNLDLERAVYKHNNPEADPTGVGYFTEAGMDKAPATYVSTKHNRVGFLEYPKCVTIGKFQGVAKSKEHEAQLKAKWAPEEVEQKVAEFDLDLPPVVPPAPPVVPPVVPQAPAAPVAPAAPRPGQPVPNTQRR